MITKGKTEQFEVQLENPSNIEVKVNIKNSNEHNFDILPPIIILPPYEIVPVMIRYTPSDLEVTEVGEIIFETEDIGRWQYLTFGQGLPPTEFEVKLIPGKLSFVI